MIIDSQQQLKVLKIIYWATTSLVSVVMVHSAVAQLIEPVDVESAFGFPGFPEYIWIELAVAKIIGVFLLLTPVYVWLKEWAYAGFFIILITSFIIQLVEVEEVGTAWIEVLVLLLVHMISYASYRILMNELREKQ